MILITAEYHECTEKLHVTEYYPVQIVKTDTENYSPVDVSNGFLFFRLTLLELLFAQLREDDSEECGIPSSVARFLANSFQKGCGAVLSLATGSASNDEVQINQISQNFDLSSPM